MTSVFRNCSTSSAEFCHRNVQTAPVVTANNPRATPAELVTRNIFHKMVFPHNWQFIKLTSGQTLLEFAEHWRTVMAAGYAHICAAISRCEPASLRRTTLEYYNDRWLDAVKKINNGILPDTIMKNLLHDLHTLQLA